MMGRPVSRIRAETPFAIWLGTLIDSGEVTRYEVAEAAGVTEKTVGEWLAGRGPVEPEKRRLAIIHGLGPNRLRRIELTSRVSPTLPSPKMLGPAPPAPPFESTAIVPQLVQLLHQTEAMSTTLREILAGLHHAADPAPPRAIPVLTPSAEGGT